MTQIEKYFQLHQKELQLSFEKARSSIKDPDVKGGRNEKIIQSFLEEHYTCNFVSTNVEIIDSLNNKSNEVDVCICNEHQPYMSKDSSFAIAEGIDFAIQVKAIIDDNELDRMIKNYISVKMLQRFYTDNDIIFTHKDNQEYFLDRIPYFCIAFESKLSLDTLCSRLKSKLREVPLKHQPDSIYVLEKGIIMNFREGKGRCWREYDDGTPLKGIQGDYTTENVLQYFILNLYQYKPIVYRSISPIVNYFQTRQKVKLVGRKYTK